MLRHDWPDVLSAHVRERRAMPFAWGEHDCCTFAGDYGLAVTGIDPMAGLRGYKTAKGALGKLRRAGYADIRAVLADRLDEVRIVEARRGDVALLRTETAFGHLCCLVLAGGMICGPDVAGLRFERQAGADAVFRFR